MPNKVLTVSVAAYNVEKYLSEALESCLVSNMSSLEVIVVNDGSSDNTLEVAQHYAILFPDSIKVIDKQNGGYGSTINASLEVASGKYFRYLDGDDCFDSDALKQYLDLLEGSNEDAVYTPFIRFYESGEPSDFDDELVEYQEGVYSPSVFGNSVHIGACSLAFKTDLLRKGHFSMTGNCFYTDVEYACLPFLHVQSILVSKIPLYRYRIGRAGQSVSIEGIERHCADLVRVCSRLFKSVDRDVLATNQYYRNYLIQECGTAYAFLTMVPPSVERKACLRQFDRLLRNDASIYSAVGKRCNRARFLRMTAFTTYAPICRYFMRRR